MIVAGGHLMVTHASNLARFMGVSDWVIAVTIVAAGTSAPGLPISYSCNKGKTWYCCWESYRQRFINLLGVLGLAGMINPSSLAPDIYGSVSAFSAYGWVDSFMVRTNWTISRAEGTILVTINLVRWYLDFAG